MGAQPAPISGGSALNPVRLFMNGYSNNPTLVMANLNIRGNVTAGGSPAFWFNRGETVNLGHPSDILFDRSSAATSFNPTYNVDYVAQGGYFGGGTMNQRLFFLASPNSAGALTVNHSSFASAAIASQNIGAYTFNILPVSFSIAPNQANAGNYANIVYGSGLQGTAGAVVSNSSDGPISLTVSSAAGDV